ncbi:DUF4183 domain-containing protein [Bacillus thuringiensis]|nr:DUF4183 domain-containing protein [Bacillus thuringiensis]
MSAYINIYAYVSVHKPLLIFKNFIEFSTGSISQKTITSKRFTSTLGTGAAFAIATTVFPAFAYYNFYLNGVLQPGGNSSVTTSPSVAITIPGGDAFDPAIPVTVALIIT